MRGIVPQQQTQTVAVQPTRQPPRTLAGTPSQAGTAGNQKGGPPAVDLGYYFK